MLEYKEKMREWPLDRQATAYRGMVFAQTTDEAVLAGANLSRNSKDKMEVRRIQDIFLTHVHPLFFWESLAHGAAPVSAGIIMD